MPPIKKRKTALPPQVDYRVQTPLQATLPPQVDDSFQTPPQASKPKPLTTPGLGSHLWFRRDPKTSKALWANVKTSLAVEFKVVNTPRDFDSEYKLLNTTTGRDFGMMFTEDDATYLFKT